MPHITLYICPTVPFLEVMDSIYCIHMQHTSSYCEMLLVYSLAVVLRLTLQHRDGHAIHIRAENDLGRQTAPVWVQPETFQSDGMIYVMHRWTKKQRGS